MPGPGIYRVAIDRDTIPEGFALEDADRFQLPRFQMFPGATVRNAVFAFQSNEGGGIEVPSRFERIIRLLVSGIRFGLIIGVCSVGLSLIYGTTGLVNFAHGELVTLGALLAWFFNSSVGGPTLTLVLASIIAVILSGVFGAALELVLWRPMVRRRSGLIARMLVSIGLALFLRYLYQVIFGAGTAVLPAVRDAGRHRLRPAEPAGQVVLRDADRARRVARRRVRAATDAPRHRDPRGRRRARPRGVVGHRRAARHPRRVGRGRALAALGGILLGVSQGVQWNMGFRLLLTMFAAVVLGGLGSAFGAMVGGLVVGVASEVSTYWISPDFKFAVALVILIIVLMVRPQGIFGVRERVG